MPKPSWKAFERHVARLFGGRRHWANSGERLDVDSAAVLAQCKLVKRLSLEELTQLAEEMERAGATAQKIGAVAVKVRRGRGRKSPLLVVVTETVWRRMHAGPAIESPAR